MSDVAALPGAQPAVFRDNWQVFEVEVSDPAEPEAVFYWVDGDTPDSTVTLVAGRFVLGCG